MAQLNTSPLGGTRDYLADDVARRAYVVDVVERVYARYGFEPLETPAMERLSTLLGKYGDEGDQLVFRVLKRGESLRDVLGNSPTEGSLSDEGLRYDLTVPLARVVAEYRHQLPTIFKRYQIQPVFRADRPGRGRFREFMQCDVDIVGSRSLVAESDVISAAADVLLALGFTGARDFTIRLNHRGALQGFLAAKGVPLAQAEPAIVAIDKLDKIGPNGVERELRERGLEPGVVADLTNALTSVPAANSEILCWLERQVDGEAGVAAVADLRTILRYCAGGPTAERLRIDPFLARGLSYYTGAIFEVAFPELNASGGGGGRYDELLGMFTGQPVPACGFSLGLERIILIMSERKMFPEQLGRRPQALVTQYDDSTIGASLALARQLRASGLRVDVYPDIKGYGAQFKYAQRRGIRYALLIGPSERDAGSVSVRDLETGEQSAVEESRVLAWLEARLSTT